MRSSTCSSFLFADASFEWLFGIVGANGVQKVLTLKRVSRPEGIRIGNDISKICNGPGILVPEPQHAATIPLSWSCVPVGVLGLPGISSV